MQTQITLQALLQCGAIIMAIFGSYKVIMEIVKAITDRHDKEKEWTKTKEDLEKGRQEIIKRYDAKLAEMEEKIDENHCDTEAKIQELRSEMLILTKCMSAVLDGLKQLNCNGTVSEAKKNLDEFLMSRAYDM